MDSIGGFGSLDLGSTPGTLTGFGSAYGRVNVADITRVCDAFDLGSNPSTPANLTKIKTNKGEKKVCQKQ